MINRVFSILEQLDAQIIFYGQENHAAPTRKLEKMNRLDMTTQ